MVLRAFSALLMVVLLWSGVSTHERAISSTSLGGHADGFSVIAAAPDAGTDHGSVDDHHLDDLPSQAQGEVVAEQPGLTTDGALPRPPGLATSAPRAGNALRVMPPFLAGLQRPPAIAVVA